MNSNYYVKVPRFIIGAFFDWNRPIKLLRRHRFISIFVWSCVNVFLVLDVLVHCGFLFNRNSSNNRVNTPSPLLYSDFPVEEASNNLNVRLLCWISTHFISREKANLIQETWGKRCDKLIFITRSYSDIGQTGGKGDHVGGIVWLNARATKDVLKHLHDHYLNDSDWFLKADIGSYVVVEQLKLMLSIRDPATPCYLAASGNTNNNSSENIADDYVLSRESVRRLVSQFRRQSPGGGSAGYDWNHQSALASNNNIRPVPNKAVSTTFHCLHRLGIFPGSTLDERGCQRFLGRSLASELTSTSNHSGNRCISDKVVVFARLGEHDFYFYEHLLYRLKLPTSIIKWW